MYLTIQRSSTLFSCAPFYVLLALWLIDSMMPEVHRNYSLWFINDGEILQLTQLASSKEERERYGNTERNTERDTYTQRQRQTDRQRHTEKQRDTQRGRDRHREKQRGRRTESQRQTERDTERERQRQTETLRERSVQTCFQTQILIHGETHRPAFSAVDVDRFYTALFSTLTALFSTLTALFSTLTALTCDSTPVNRFFFCFFKN